MDVIYKFKPDKEGSPGELGVQFKAEDLIEKTILTDITGIAMSQNVTQVVFGSDKTSKQKFSQRMFELTQNLFNANLHRRNYKIKEKQEIKTFKRESQKNPNKQFDLTKNPIELITELNGFLTALKSSLDSLAVCLEPLLQQSFHGWHNVKDKVDGQKKSGGNILNTLRNKPKAQLQAITPLIKLVEREATWLTYLVSLRDSPVHNGGLKNISELRYTQNKREVEAQIITHPNGSHELVEAFNKRAMESIVDFSTKIILYAIQGKVPGVTLTKSNG